MDFQGQRLAELIFYWVILSFGIVGWIIGYFQQDFTVVFQAWLVGVLLSVVVCPLTFGAPRLLLACASLKIPISSLFLLILV